MSNNNNNNNNNNNILGLANHDSLEWSLRQGAESLRHVTDYEILQTIGRGAFGTVDKVRNKVDKRVYAMKRVHVSHFSKSILREVKVLSSLQHKHVVRYFAAWVEKGHHEDNAGGDAQELWTSETTIQQENQDPKCNLCDCRYRDWEVSFEQWGLLDSVLQPLDLCTECYIKSLPPTTNVSDIDIREKRVLKDYLFIVMEYCDGTLEDAMAESTDEQKWSYFLQCILGLQYLHSSGIIHRDLKPNNIFIRDGVIKIGDMGLAATVATQEKQQSPTSSPRLASSTTSESQVGTYLYTAPEAATNEECDIYALGVVLVELFSTFATAMERAETLDNLKRGKLPEKWKRRYPNQAKLAQKMISQDPSERPSCREILNDLQPPSRSSNSITTAQLHQVIREKESTIQSLRELLELHGISHDHI